MHTVVPGWLGASSVWLIPLIWRLVRSALPGGASLRGPGTIRLWLGFLCVLVASCTLEATLIHISGFNALGHVLSEGLAGMVGHIAAPLAMTALFVVSLPWFLDFSWRSVLASADASLGLGLNLSAHRDDDDTPRRERRSRRPADNDTTPARGTSSTLGFDSQTTLDGSPRRRPTVWRPPATLARAAGAAASGAAAAGVNADQSAPSWRVEPRLQETADMATGPARSEPVAPAGWLHTTPPATGRTATGPAAAVDARRQMARSVDATAAPLTPPLKQTPAAGASATWRAEPVRPPLQGARAAASAASAVSAASSVALPTNALGAASAAARGVNVATPLDPLASPLSSPLSSTFGSPQPARRNGPPPVAGSTAARAAASAPPPPRPKPPRPFVWPTKSARDAMRTQPGAPMATSPDAAPAWSQPASPAQPGSPAPLTANALDTLRSIEENAARWTTLAGASLARRSAVEAQAANAGASAANLSDPRFPDAEAQPAVEAAANDVATVAAVQPAADVNGELEASPATWVHEVQSVAATVAPTTFAAPQSAVPHDTGAASHDYATPIASIPRGTYTLAPDTATSSAAPFAPDDAQPEAGAPFFTPAHDSEPVAQLARLQATSGTATGQETTNTTPAAFTHSVTPDALPAEDVPLQGVSIPAPRDGSVAPFAFAEPLQPAWPATEHGLAPWILLDDEPLEDIEALTEPADANEALAVFAPALTDTAVSTAQTKAQTDAPIAAPVTIRADTDIAAIPLTAADANADETPSARIAIDADATGQQHTSALPSSNASSDGSNIVRFPRVAHDVQRVEADAPAQLAAGNGVAAGQAASVETTATGPSSTDAAPARDAADPAQEETPTASAAPTPPAWGGIALTPPRIDTATPAIVPPAIPATPVWGADALTPQRVETAQPTWAQWTPQTSPDSTASTPAAPTATSAAADDHFTATHRELAPAHAAQPPAAPWEIAATAAPSAPSPAAAEPEPPFAAAPSAPSAAPATDSADIAAEGPAARQPVRGHAPTSFVFEPLAASAVELPGLDLLERASSDVEPVSEEKLAETGQLIEQRLQEFKVPVTVVGASAGPVITRFEIEPALGVRGSQIVGLMKDLSRGLGLTSIRVVETIPGKTCMGLELPNARRHMIRLSEILESAPWQRSPSKLTIAMGKDIVGQPVVTDLAKAPHMLVAGTTGSGKSVAINAMILSLLYKATPEEVRLIMIDPKMLELSVYEGIPHLLAPVVTDMKLAANALNWCVGEMEKRYRLMSAVGVRNLAGFNQKIRDAEAHEKKIGNPFSLTPEAPEPLAPLPMIVVVIDELADLMMVAGKKIEELIARLAQKARAAGIHLILATQRPSVDVITGLIKANIPTRVAFQVSSKIDSRTILDQMGAESLLGQGDMLFLPPGTGYPQRVHGAFVADEEVHAVVEYLKQFGEPEYVEGILDGPAGDGAPQDLFGDAPDAEADPLYDEAVAFVVRTRRASISSVQRQLRIGYNRAARLVEQMEAAGLVSPMGINGSREVLVPGQAE